jgi:RNA polymerase sigma-70 factor, ECF subfamily
LNEADLKLVRAARGGDRIAFGRLVERFKGRVYAMSLAITGDAEEAQELTQETFVRALQSIPRLEVAEKFPSWLRGITNTVGKDVRRKAARERRHVQAAGQIKPFVAGPADVAVANREASGRERALLAELVAGLPENCRVALDLRFREDLSYGEIGALMGVPVSTVRGLLYRGTKALRLKLKPILKRAGGAVE